jgi:hypothetical protein
MPGVKKSKHDGALTIMIAPVKTKKMKAVKKAPGGAAMGKMKMKMMKKGGKLKMVKGPDGKMVPFYAADGKGKMMDGGSMKKKMSLGGRMGSKEMMESMKKDDKMLRDGGKVKGKMMYGASMKKAMYGAKMKKKAMYGAKMKKMENGGKVKKDLEKQKKNLLSRQNIMRYGDKESGFSKGSIEKMGVIAYQNKKRYNKPQTGVLNKKAISKQKVTPKVKKTNKR